MNGLGLHAAVRSTAADLQRGGAAGSGGAAPAVAVLSGSDLPSADAGLDAASLARLRELDPNGTNHLLERVFQAFESSVRRLLPELRQARIDDNHAGIRHVVHTLKSSSASIGALRLAQLCAEIEHMIRTNDVADLQARLEQADAEIDVVLQVLRQMLDRRG